MSLLKRGGDNMLNGIAVGAIMGILVGSSNIGFIQSIVHSIMGMIPASYISWAGTYANSVVFGIVGALVGWWADYM